MSQDIVALARRHKHVAATHYDGCETDHIGCLVNKLADEIERLRAEIKRLHQAHQAACEGGDLLREEIERLREALQESACACSSIRECVSECAKDGKCPHLIARNALEGKP